MIFIIPYKPEVSDITGYPKCNKHRSNEKYIRVKKCHIHGTKIRPKFYLGQSTSFLHFIPRAFMGVAAPLSNGKLFPFPTYDEREDYRLVRLLLPATQPSVMKAFETDFMLLGLCLSQACKVSEQDIHRRKVHIGKRKHGTFSRVATREQQPNDPLERTSPILPFGNASYPSCTIPHTHTQNKIHGHSSLHGYT